MRELLESIRAVVDEIYRAEPEKWRAKRMVLFPPADEKTIARFFAKPPRRGIPESYAEFLRASDGMEEGWQRITLFGTRPASWKKLLDRIELLETTVEGNVSYQMGDTTDALVRTWEVDRNSLYPASHPVIGGSPWSGALIYDSHSRSKDGSMEICDWHLADGIRGRYRDLQSYFEGCLADAETYRKRKLTKKKRK